VILGNGVILHFVVIEAKQDANKSIAVLPVLIVVKVDIPTVSIS